MSYQKNQATLSAMLEGDIKKITADMIKGAPQEQLVQLCLILLNAHESLTKSNQDLQEQVKKLTDEINKLKGEKGRPNIKPNNKNDPSPGPNGKEPPRPRNNGKEGKKDALLVSRTEEIKVFTDNILNNNE